MARKAPFKLTGTFRIKRSGEVVISSKQLNAAIKALGKKRRRR